MRPAAALTRAGAPAGRLLAWLVVAVLATGCLSTTVRVEGPFPDPLVQRLPLTVGLHLSEEFRSYSIEEEIPRHGTWTVRVGGAQTALMRRLVDPMFQRVVEIEDPAAAAEGEALDAVLIPRVEDLQFAIPFQTKSKFYEVWIKYRFELVAPNGSKIASWSETGYGKTRSGVFGSDANAVEKAAVEALRDAGAFLAIGFSQREPIRDWLSNRANDPLRAAGAEASANANAGAGADAESSEAKQDERTNPPDDA